MQTPTRAFQALHEVAVAAAGLRDPNELAALVVDRARDLLEADAAALYWFFPESGTLNTLAHNDPHETGPEPPFKPGEGAAGRAYSEARAVNVDDYRGWPEALPSSVGRGIESGLAVPLMVSHRAVGSLGVFNRRTRAWSSDDEQLLMLFAAQVAPALEAARLIQETIEQAHNFRALHEVAIAAGGLRDLAELGRLVVDRARQLLKSESATLRWWDPATESLRLLASIPAVEGGNGERIAAGQGSLGQAFERQEPAIIENYAQAPGTVEWATKDGVKSALGVPVMAREEPLGALGVATYSDRHYTRQDVQLLTLLAAQVGPALEAARLYHESERRRLEAEALVGDLADSELKLRTIFDQAPIGLARIDLDGKIQEANLSLRTMLGYPEGEVIGLHFDRVLSTPGGSELDLVSAFLKGEGDRYSAELPVRRQDGTQRWGSVSLSVVRGPDHEPLYLIGMLEDISDRKAQTELLEYQTLHDSLTDLPNRTLLHDRLQQAILTAQREHRQLALLIMDLNRFKEVNDTFGHHLGDALLQQVGPRIMAQLRESDTVARLGGDEFAVVLPTADDETGATLAARRLLKALEEPFVIEDRRFEVGGSIGIAISPQHGADPATLMRRADIAMYVAKRTRSGYAVYSPEDDKHSPGRLSLMGELRDALQGDALVLHYQPQVALTTGTVRGVEALIRWQHPRHGLMPPDEFLTVAEETGLIVGVSEWALNAALEQARSWGGRAELPVAVNLSMQNLQDQNLPALIASLLQRHSMRAERLKIEVTETALMADPQRSAEIFAQLREMGVKISIDDFGSGYSSLAYLKQLPVDELKIDRSFVIGIAPSAEEVAIVRSAIEIGHSLGLTVIAEGVETQAAWDILAELGCDLVQGYLISRPLPARQLGRWLSAGWTPRARDLMS